MKQSFKTSKLYFGFPIFILGYQDQNFGHNITTCSSSYSLGDWLVIGVGSEENAADQIKQYQKFTVNIPDENFMQEMEQAGFISHREKLERLGLDYEISERTQAPILEACPVVLDCQVDRIIEEDGISISLLRFLIDWLIQNSWMIKGILKMIVLRRLTLWGWSSACLPLFR